MHVLLYHDALIPPLKYGGTERIVGWLARALVRRKHRVTLLARPGSSVPGAPEVTVLGLDQKRQRQWREQIPSDVDVLHLFSTPDSALPRPFLVTIQGNGKPGERFHPNTVFLSRRHAANHGSRCFIYNGIPPEDYPLDGDRADYLVFLAKASWKVKNLAGAVEIARAADMPLQVLGSRSWPAGLHRLLPAWRGVRYRGMVGDAEKKQILRRARGLLFPVRWEEPFGIAITEALACGAPVFGTPYGSLPEIVTETCGVLSTRAEDLVAALRTRSFPPSGCRARVFEGFSDNDMALGYANLYRSVLERGNLGAFDQDLPNGPVPQTRSSVSAETLLPWEFLKAGSGKRSSQP